MGVVKRGVGLFWVFFGTLILFKFFVSIIMICTSVEYKADNFSPVYFYVQGFLLFLVVFYQGVCKAAGHASH